MDQGPIYQELSSHFTAQLPFVAYRKPNKNFIKAYLQDNDEINHLQDYSEKGFVMAPFDSAKRPIIFREKDCRFRKEIFEKLRTEYSSPSTFTYSNSEEEHLRYLKLVEAAIEKIKKEKIEKIVLSRSENIKVPDINIFESFRRLISKHPEAFVYIWYHPKFGIWMGASPERLLTIKNNCVGTVSLAATKASEEISWKGKEYKEQQLVTDFLEESLSKVLDNLTISAVKTIQTGNLYHLKTNISGKLKNLEINLPILIEKIHPTPAVCGSPRELAKDFILKNENYDREFYTGFLGELNLSENKGRNKRRKNLENLAFFNSNKLIDLFVNLRCVKILDHTAFIYVGGGITSDSIPEDEWQETLNKSMTIKSVL